jgi:hypothetical protein
LDLTGRIKLKLKQKLDLKEMTDIAAAKKLTNKNPVKIKILEPSPLGLFAKT